jgi:DUF2075 family protein
MIIYQESKARYLADVDNNVLKQRLVKAFQEKKGWVPNDQRVWANVSNEIQVAIEYYISAPGLSRIDVLLAGSDGHTDNGMIIELKAWETADLSDVEDMVVCPYHGNPTKPHPCVQARQYKGLILRFNQDIREQDIHLHSAAYLFNLHRRKPEPLEDSRYQNVLKDSRLFLADDVTQLRQFIEKVVPRKAKKDVIFLIENGRMRPADELIERVSSMLEGNEEFELIDEQNVAFQIIRHQLQLIDMKDLTNRHVFVVEGGPGTGKSVIAVRLLAEILKAKRMGFFVAPNAAFRKTIIEYLAKGNNGYREDGEALLRSSWNFHDIDFKKDKCNDVLIVDEAHRLKDKANRYKGKSMVEDMVRAARISVFFIDETQRVQWSDSGSIEAINKAANKFKAVYHEPLQLTAQYRCNGSAGYINWLNDVLQIGETGNYDNWGDGQYEFKVFERAEDLYAALKEKNDKNKARLVAGYSWEWPTKGRARGTTVRHVEADGLSLPWNYSTGNWATSKDGIEQVGCIHTSQGIEFDWLGVLIGPDLICQDGKVIGVPKKRAKSDKSLYGSKKDIDEAENNADKKKALLEKVQTIIKSTYKVLLSRGRMGCYVWCADAGLREYMKQRLALASSTAGRIVHELAEELKYVDFVPVYSLEAAAGSFDEPEQVDRIGWMKVPQSTKVNRRHFVAKVVGKSMEPKISDGSYCLFRFGVEGSRTGRTVLCELQGRGDPETGGAYTVKKYSSEKRADADTEWQHDKITLLPLNKDYEPIVLDPNKGESLKVIAEFVSVL